MHTFGGEQTGIKIDKVINITLPEWITVMKISARRSCPACRRSFNVADVNKGTERDGLSETSLDYLSSSLPAAFNVHSHHCTDSSLSPSAKPHLRVGRTSVLPTDSSHVDKCRGSTAGFLFARRSHKSRRVHGMLDVFLRLRIRAPALTLRMDTGVLARRLTTRPRSVWPFLFARAPFAVPLVTRTRREQTAT